MEFRCKDRQPELLLVAPSTITSQGVVHNYFPKFDPARFPSIIRCMVNAFYEALYQTLLYDMPTTMILLNKLHSAVNATSVIFFALNAAAQMKKFARVNQLMNHIDLVLADEKK